MQAQIESLTAVLDEIKPLLPAHYTELSLHRDHGFPLRPQFHVYLERDAAGLVVCATLREEGKICGYKLGFCAPGLHYETCLTALPDIFFLAPEHRGGYGALKLFRCYEAELRRGGVALWIVSIKVNKGVPGTERLFLALGFEVAEQYFCKWIS